MLRVFILNQKQKTGGLPTDYTDIVKEVLFYSLAIIAIKNIKIKWQ